MPFAAYHELVLELAALKREGFTAPSPQQEAAPAPQLATEIEAEIISLGVDPSTERQLRKTAWELLRTGTSPADIAAKIKTGETVEL